MPHLSSDALRQDPEGLSFLRAVLAKPEPCQAAVAAVDEAIPAPARETVIVETAPASSAGRLPTLRAAADAA